MARSTQIETKLAPDRWARLMGINPIHFNGIDVSSMRNVHCGTPWTQHEWQNSDAVGIEQVIRAIHQAESNIEQLVKHRLKPSWEVEEVKPTIRPYRPEFSNFSVTDIRGYPQAVQVDWGHFIASGVRATALLEEGAAIVYSDPDNDQYSELATVTVLNVDEDLDVCQVFITPPDEDVKIRPIDVSLSGTTLTITFPRHLAVTTESLERYVWDAIDGTDDARFLEEVDVYREYNDQSVNASLFWEREGETRTAFLAARGNPKFSFLAYTQGAYTDGAWVRTPYGECTLYQPDRVQVNYYAGWRDKSLACPLRDMSAEIEYIVAQYACTFFERPPCACCGEKSLVMKCMTDLAFQDGGSQVTYKLDEDDLASPLGTQYGAIQAWRWIRKWRHRVT